MEFLLSITMKKEDIKQRRSDVRATSTQEIFKVGLEIIIFFKDYYDFKLFLAT